MAQVDPPNGRENKKLDDAPTNVQSERTLTSSFSTSIMDEHVGPHTDVKKVEGKVA